MGAGKTKTAIDNFSILFQQHMVNRVLVTSNKGSYAGWAQREIPKHCPVEKRLVHLWRGLTTRKEKDELLHFLTSHDEDCLKILVMNVEALSSKGKALDLCENFLSKGKSMMIVDESTTIKNPSAQRTKNVMYLGKLAHYRRVLTGSPVTRSPLDLYSQMSFIVPGSVGSSYFSFRAKYAIMQKKNFGGRDIQIVVGYQNIDSLVEKIKPHMIRVKKEDCLDLPPKVFTQRDVELTEEQIKLYEDIKKHAYTLLNGESEVSAMAVITQILRLHQIVCGHLVDDERNVHPIRNNRIQALMDVLEETEGNAIIWCNYRYDVTAICAELRRVYGGDSVVQYDGSINEVDRHAAIERFQSGKARFFVGTVATGGYGITLTAASTVVYYSNSYDLEKRAQSEDRAHRIGQNKSVTYVDLVCPGTVDEKILGALRQKLNMASLLMGDGYKNWIV